MLSRTEAEQLIQQLTGGASPKHGDTLIFNQDVGWIFASFDLYDLSALPTEDPGEAGKPWVDSGVLKVSQG